MQSTEIGSVESVQRGFDRAAGASDLVAVVRAEPGNPAITALEQVRLPDG